jgi:thymidylate synthase
MKNYQDLVHKCLHQGDFRGDRTGTGTYSLFGEQLRFSLEELPLLTTKRIHIPSVIHELLWILRGDTNVSSLNAAGVSIWDEWADSKGSLGPVYGKQWCSWQGPNGKVYNQIEELVHNLKTKPTSRRHVVSAWNVADLPDETKSPQVNASEGKMALPPCHTMFQFYVGSDNTLSCQLYQRSADVFLGVPFNIASYALFTCMLAHVLGMKPGNFIHTFGDVHLYSNHVDQAKELLSRTPRTLPTLTFARQVDSIFDFKYKDFIISDYKPYKGIKAPVAI